MANELNVGTPSGANVYATVRREDGTVFNGVTFVPWNDPDVATYAVVLTDRGGDYYSADLPVAITAPGQYFISYYLRGGTVPANTDFKLPADETIDWLVAGVYEPTDAEWLLKLGPENTNIWTDMRNDGNTVGISAEQNLVKREGRTRLRGMLNLPRLGVDGVWRKPADPWVFDADATDTIWTVLCFYFGGYALKLKLDQQTPQGQQNAGDKMLADGDAILQRFIDAGLPGVTLEETEVEEETAGAFAFVPIVRDVCSVTGDENYRPPLWY